MPKIKGLKLMGQLLVDHLKKTNQGFTLLETVLVLIVSSIVLLMPTLIAKSVIEEVKRNLFFEEFQSKLTSMQTVALLSNERAKITVLKAGKIKYEMEGQPAHRLNKALFLPEKLTTPTDKVFYFNSGTGNVSSFSTIYFNSSKKQYQFKFQIGSGRYFFEVLENE